MTAQAQKRPVNLRDTAFRRNLPKSDGEAALRLVTILGTVNDRILATMTPEDRAEIEASVARRLAALNAREG